MNTAALESLAEINPKAPARETLNGGEFDFVPMASVREDGAMQVEEQRPYSEVAKGFTPFCNGDILIAKITPCFENNKIAMANVKTKVAFGSTEFHVVRADPDKIDSKYLLYFLRQDSVRASGERRMTGSAGQRRVPRSFLKELQIPLPPLEEQKRIAAILDQADALRRLRQRAIDRLNTLGQAIFYEMFLNNDVEYVPLINVLEDVKMGPFGSLLHKSDYVQNGVPLINPIHIQNGRVAPDPEFSVSSDKVVELESYRLKIGDIVIGRRGEMGRCAVINDFEDGYICGTGSMILRPDCSKVSSDFLSFYLRTRSARKHLEKCASGVTMPNLNSKSLDGVPVPLPSLNQQHKFSQILGLIQEKNAYLQNGWRKIDSLFLALQKRAFEGEL